MASDAGGCGLTAAVLEGARVRGGADGPRLAVHVGGRVVGGAALVDLEGALGIAPVMPGDVGEVRRAEQRGTDLVGASATAVRPDVVLEHGALWADADAADVAAHREARVTRARVPPGLEDVVGQHPTGLLGRVRRV